MTGRAISWKARSILPDRARSRRLEPVAGPIEVSPCPGELVLHPYYIPERKTRPREEGQSRRRRKIEVDGPRDPFVCGNGLPTEREGEGGSDGVMATRAGRARGGPAERERGGTGRWTTPGACYFGPEARHARRRQGTPRRRPRVMMPRPPQSKHASSLPPCAPLPDRSLARLPPSAPRNDRLSISISLRGHERARLRQRNCIEPETGRPDGERVRTSRKRVRRRIKKYGKGTLLLILCCEITLIQAQGAMRI